MTEFMIESIFKIMNLESPELSELRDKGFVSFRQIFNYWPNLRLQQLNNKYCHLKDLPINSLRNLGFDIKNGELGLIPIDIPRYLFLNGGEQIDFLIHEGFEKSERIYESEMVPDGNPLFDNRINMTNLSVWGNPSNNFATFLKPPYSHVVPMARIGSGSRVYVDINELQARRKIYVDPEMYIPVQDKNFKGAEFDKPPNSLMVFGGIPVEAIKRIEPIQIREL
jgi:hypothetical protein